jgi:hypothetical protein
VVARTRLGTGCPFCAGQRASVTNRLAIHFPEVFAQWHPTRNGKLNPADLVVGSNRKVWWKCSKGPDHEWACPIHRRTTEGSGCPFCANQATSITNSFAVLRPALAAEWHPERNGALEPKAVVVGSGRLVWWKCPRGPDHEWQDSVAHRTQRGSGCPFCAGRRVSVTNSLALVFPEAAREWHPLKNGDVSPREVCGTSRVLVWWQCPRRHAWRCQIRERTVLGRRCPSCAAELAT